MFLKAALTFLAVGAISVNAMTIPVARSPAPEPESQELKAWMLKRDLSYDLFSRELQALDELFSREPEDWAQWAKRGSQAPNAFDNDPRNQYVPVQRVNTPTPQTTKKTDGQGRDRGLFPMTNLDKPARG